MFYAEQKTKHKPVKHFLTKNKHRKVVLWLVALTSVDEIAGVEDRCGAGTGFLREEKVVFVEGSRNKSAIYTYTHEINSLVWGTYYLT